MSFIIISLKKSLAYRAKILFSVVGSIISILVTIALWHYVYAYDSERTRYMTTYVIISTLIAFFYSNAICDAIAQKVITGNFSLDLLRPISFLLVQYFEDLGNILATLLLKALPIGVVFSTVLFSCLSGTSIATLLMFFFSVLLGHIMYAILYSIIGFMAFKFTEVWPFRRLLDDTIRFLSGSFIPLSLLPPWLNDIANCLPFRYLYSTPIELMLGTTTLVKAFHQSISALIWIVFLSLFLFLLYKNALNKCTVQGG